MATFTGMALGSTALTGYAIGANVVNFSPDPGDWDVVGGVEKITVNDMPEIAPPVVAGGVEKFTITG